MDLKQQLRKWRNVLKTTTYRINEHENASLLNFFWCSAVAYLQSERKVLQMMLHLPLRIISVFSVHVKSNINLLLFKISRYSSFSSLIPPKFFYFIIIILNWKGVGWSRSHIYTASNHWNRIFSQSWGDTRQESCQSWHPHYLWQVPDPQQALLLLLQLSPLPAKVRKAEPNRTLQALNETFWNINKKNQGCVLIFRVFRSLRKKIKINQNGRQ